MKPQHLTYQSHYPGQGLSPTYHQPKIMQSHHFQQGLPRLHAKLQNPLPYNQVPFYTQHKSFDTRYQQPPRHPKPTPQSLMTTSEILAAAAPEKRTSHLAHMQDVHIHKPRNANYTPEYPAGYGNKTKENALSYQVFFAGIPHDNLRGNKQRQSILTNGGQSRKSEFENSVIEEDESPPSPRHYDPEEPLRPYIPENFNFQEEQESARRPSREMSLKRKKKRNVWNANTSHYSSQKSFKKADSSNPGAGSRQTEDILTHLIRSPTRDEGAGEISGSTKELQDSLLRHLETGSPKKSREGKGGLNHSSSYNVANGADTAESSKSTTDPVENGYSLPVVPGRSEIAASGGGGLPVIKKSGNKVKKERSPARVLHHSPSTDMVRQKGRGKTPKVQRAHATPKLNPNPYTQLNSSVDRGVKIAGGSAQRVTDLTSPRFEGHKPSIVNVKTADYTTHAPQMRLAGLSTLKNLDSHHQRPRAAPTYVLSDQERSLYGERSPAGYMKLDLLGKGGCALVWLGQDLQRDELVAMKQFPRGGGKGSTQMLMASKVDLSSYRTELAIGQHLFMSGKFDRHPGLRHVARFVRSIQEPKDYWMLHEVGGKPLSKMLFELKGEFYNSERIYHVHQQPFLHALKQDNTILKDLLRRLMEFIALLSEAGIVHSDLKSENILLTFDEQRRRIASVKVIDFGSGFMASQLMNISQTTPQYMAPEALKMLELKKGRGSDQQKYDLERSVQPWSMDMWSIGAIFLEIITGFPMWLGLKGRTVSGKRSIISMGVFSAQGRQPLKIIQKQRSFLNNLQKSLRKFDCYGLERDPAAIDLLARMLDLNPLRRISPQEALMHPFLV